MGFTQEIKDQVLVAAARHCCVCHESKGRNIEVHHILPKANGGTDTYDNAIALCFDCHADAGHYNPRHPRGSKLSPDELKKHRENWFSIVKNNGIAVAEENLLHCRYFITRNFNSFKEITHGLLDNFPIDKVLLLQNSVYSFQRNIICSHKLKYRNDGIVGDRFENKEEYKTAHPDANIRKENDSEYFPYFEATRLPDNEEIKQRIYDPDCITKLLVDSNVPPKEICTVATYLNECGDGAYYEQYYLRSFWAVYLVITNTSSKYLQIESLSGVVSEKENYRAWLITNGEYTDEIHFPEMKLEPNQSVIVPIMSVLPEFESPFRYIECSHSYMMIPDEYQSQSLTHLISTKNNLKVNVVGPAIRPDHIKYKIDEKTYVQEVHNFDFTNLYVIDRNWECGSCPHIFFRRYETGSLIYYGELFSNCAFRLSNQEVIVPNGCHELIIVEIENETTYIREVFIENVLKISNQKLKKSDTLTIKVKGGEKIIIIGSYSPTKNVFTQKNYPIYKNELIKNYVLNES